MAEAAPNTPVAQAEKSVAMELKRHYVPHKLNKIVGWNRPEKKVKDAAGNERIVQEAGFINDEMAPAPFPGVGFARKIWSGTVIEVPESEARDMRAKKIAEAWL